MSKINPLQATEMDINECLEHFNILIKQSKTTGARQGILSIICLILGIILIFLSSNGIGVALLIASVYFWQEANKADLQGNMFVAIYPLALLVNSQALILKAIKEEVQIIATRSSID